MNAWWKIGKDNGKLDNRIEMWGYGRKEKEGTEC